MGKPKRRTFLSLAYGAYGVLGLAALIASFAAWSLRDSAEGGAAFLALFVLLPLSLPVLVAVPLALIFSLVLWREWPLPVLGLMTIGLGLHVTYGRINTPMTEAVACALAAIYAFAALGPAAYWFFKRRKRFQQR
jgi:hypothetical protein